MSITALNISFNTSGKLLGMKSSDLDADMLCEEKFLIVRSIRKALSRLFVSP